MKAKETGQNMSFFSFPMGMSAKAKRRRSLWVGAIQRQGFVPTHKLLKCAVDTLCLELQIVTQASLTIFQQLTLGMKNSVAREEQRLFHRRY